MGLKLRPLGCKRRRRFSSGACPEMQHQEAAGSVKVGKLQTGFRGCCRKELLQQG